MYQTNISIEEWIKQIFENLRMVINKYSILWSVSVVRYFLGNVLWKILSIKQSYSLSLYVYLFAIWLTHGQLRANIEGELSFTRCKSLPVILSVHDPKVIWSLVKRLDP